MKLYFHKYYLTPIERLNAKDDGARKVGLYLKIEANKKTYLADYFPHIALGDTPLNELKLSDAYLQNCIELATQVDQKINYRSFKNHLLNKFAKGKVTKLKLKNPSDFDLVSKGIEQASLIRLDANGSFQIEELNNLLKEIDYKKIEYIEDPSTESNWDDLIIPSASDFIQNPHAEFIIIKPNRKMLFDKGIISSYMGSDWGRVLCANFLHLYGNFELVHGINTPGIYNEQNNDLFNEENLLDQQNVELLRESILDADWEEWHD